MVCSPPRNSKKVCRRRDLKSPLVFRRSEAGLEKIPQELEDILKDVDSNGSGRFGGKLGSTHL